MTKDILVYSGPDETSIAILEDGELAELYIEAAGQEKLIGNIYRGKVERVLPGMQCAFVDIGVDKNAFLYAGDIFLPRDNSKDSEPHTIAKIETLVTQGQEITVQVIKEAIETKGSRVTTNITLPGRVAVLAPNDSGIGISKKIKDSNERDRLKQIAQRLCPQEVGIILRTTAEGLEEPDIQQDIQSLVKLWEMIGQKEKRGVVPRCLYQEPGIVQKLAREYLKGDIHKLILNNRSQYEALMELLDTMSPELKMKVEYFYNDYDMFEYYHVETAIQRALSRKVWLKCGGYLVFDKTEALTVIDVNTGKFVGRDNLGETILKTNLEAAQVIANQIRLRDISGIILIDFIDMEESTHKNLVLSTLREAVKQDGTKAIVVGMTTLGLVEMTRKKVRNTLQQALTVSCPLCGGTGRVKKNHKTAACNDSFITAQTDETTC